MPKSPNQKLKLPVLLRFLQRQSDEKHPVTLQQMIEELERWDIEAERKSLYDDLEKLRSFGADIVSVRGFGFRAFGAAGMTRDGGSWIFRFFPSFSRVTPMTSSQVNGVQATAIRSHQAGA